MVSIILKITRNKKLLGLYFLLAVFFTGTSAKAASLLVSPNSGQYNIGQTFTINVLVSSPDQSINVVSGELNFDAAKLEVVSVTKTGSIIGLWVQEPNFSNVLGTINFEGVILNPGFLGSNGKIVSVIFKTKNPGIIKLLLSNTSVLANDGEGTDVLNSLIHGNYTIDGEMTTTTKAVVTSTKSTTTVTKPKTTATTTTTTTTKSSIVSAAELVTVEEIKREKLTNPNVKFNIKVNDPKWEIDKFIIRIDSASAIIWNDDGTGIYSAPKLKPGGHILELTVLGKDNKSFSIKKGFIIKSLKVPIWEKWLQTVKVNEPFILEGSTDYPSSEVTITVIRNVANQSWWVDKGISSSLNDTADQNQIREYFKVITDEEGDFKIDLTGKMSAGNYFVMANVTDNEGGTSYNTYGQAIEVVDDSFINSGRLAKTIICLLAVSTSIFIITMTIIAFHKYLYKCKLASGKIPKNDFGSLEKSLNILIDKFNKYTELTSKNNQQYCVSENEKKKIEEIRGEINDVKSMLDENSK